MGLCGWRRLEPDDTTRSWPRRNEFDDFLVDSRCTHVRVNRSRQFRDSPKNLSNLTTRLGSLPACSLGLLPLWVVR